MPEISRFLGIVVYMYFNDHNPPHFHVQYGEYRASIEIKSLQIIEGDIPSRVLGLIVEWASMHKDELHQNWENLQKTGKYSKIEPLI